MKLHGVIEGGLQEAPQGDLQKFLKGSRRFYRAYNIGLIQSCQAKHFTFMKIAKQNTFCHKKRHLASTNLGRKEGQGILSCISFTCFNKRDHKYELDNHFSLPRLSVFCFLCFTICGKDWTGIN